MARRDDQTDPNDPYAARKALLDGMGGADPNEPVGSIQDNGPNSPVPPRGSSMDALPPPVAAGNEPSVPSGPIGTQPTGRVADVPKTMPSSPMGALSGMATGTSGGTLGSDIGGGVSGILSNLTGGQTDKTAPAPGSVQDQIAQLYKQAGITDGGRGSGFADAAYWAEHPSEVANGRLAADLAGTGTDQPTGTPGTGVWQNSGKNAGAGGGAGGGTPYGNDYVEHNLGPAPVAGAQIDNGGVGRSVDGPPTMGSAPGMAAGGAGIAAGALGAAGAAGGGNFNATMRQTLLDQMKGLTGVQDENSPTLKPAITAYNNQSQRDQQQERDALAERSYASGGLHSGGFNTELQQGMESAAGKRANFSGSLVYQNAQNQRQQLQQMLQTATNAGLTDSAQQIQMKIAQIDAQLRNKGLDQQMTQAGGNLGFNYAQLQAQMNRDALLGGMNG